MLALAISVLFTLCGIVAVATIAHCLTGARAAYAQLMHEGEVMRADLALQVAAAERQLRPAPRSVRSNAMPRRRPAPVRPLARQACAAA